MVHELKHFNDYFKNYHDQYILIGGSACSLVVDELGSEFRSTKDLDIVIVAEALTLDFVQQFWQYISEGGYNYIRKSNSKRTFYRFEKPQNPIYPKMLEILSTNETLLKDPNDANIARLAIDDEVVSLSAILLDSEYYRFIHNCKLNINGISTVGINCLIPLKMKAWLDLKEKKKSNPEIRSSEVNKHKNDVLRLEALLDDIGFDTIPSSVEEDIIRFSSEIKSENVDLRSIGIKDRSLDVIIQHFHNYYGIK